MSLTRHKGCAIVTARPLLGVSMDKNNVVQLSDHARTSSTATDGRSTSTGQTASGGQLSENQRITSSYLRAVKVFSTSSKRSKKRQSPAAKRPIVAILTDLAAAKAEAQAMSFDRSSDSMATEDSRKIPTAQAKSVGKFRLVEKSDSADKSAMATVQEVRNLIQHVLDRNGHSPITVAEEWGLERTHIWDFLDGRKDSLKTEVLKMFSDQYGIKFELLIITRPKKKRTVA